MSKNPVKSTIFGPSVILVSASPRRQEMLRDLDIPFKRVISDVPEGWKKLEDPKRVAVKLAKAKALQSPKKNGLVVAMDTIVAIGKTKLGKPKNHTDTARMLRALSGRMHTVVTGMALHYEGKIVTDFETTSVYFRRIEADEIEWYLRTREPFDKAGAYAIQGKGRVFVRKIDGCYSNVIGFPIYRFQECLSKLGLRIYDLMK